MSVGLRQALILAASGVLLVVVIVALVRRRLITTRYALGWIVIALFVVLGAAFTNAVSSVGDISGMTPTAVFLAVATVVLLAITLQLSISVSGLQAHVRDVAEAQALLEARSEEPGVHERGRARSGDLVVVPAYNEERTVGDVVQRVLALGLDCLVVDDGSDDETAARAAAAGARVARLPVNLGVGGALQTGFRDAVAHGYERVVQCDADGQHPPELIPELLDAQRASGADLLIGSRFLAGAETFPIGRLRRSVMRWFSFLVRSRSGVQVTDTTSGFRCVAQPLVAEFARSFPMNYLGDTFEAVLVTARAGYSIVECPTRIDARGHGESTASFAGALQAILRSTVVALGGITFRIAPASARRAPPRDSDPVPVDRSAS
jgi:GT2 family glycosyltransferase